MSRYRFRGKDIEGLTREEAIQALHAALVELERLTNPRAALVLGRLEAAPPLFTTEPQPRLT